MLLETLAQITVQLCLGWTTSHTTTESDKDLSLSGCKWR